MGRWTPKARGSKKFVRRVSLTGPDDNSLTIASRQHRRIRLRCHNIFFYEEEFSAGCQTLRYKSKFIVWLSYNTFIYSSLKKQFLTFKHSKETIKAKFYTKNTFLQQTSCLYHFYFMWHFINTFFNIMMHLRLNIEKTTFSTMNFILSTKICIFWDK